jgi:hypothetical protein
MLVFVFDGTRQLQACPVCLSIGDPFRVPHPHAIRLSVAARNAIDDGLLSAHGDRLQADPHVDLIRIATHQWVESFHREMGPAKGNRLVRIDVLIVDRSAYFRIELRGKLLQIFPLAQARHVQGDAVIVTTRAVIAALADLDMTTAEAESLKLLEVEGDQGVLSSVGISGRD